MNSGHLVDVSHWLNANKLTLNPKKSNFVIFCPPQKRLDYLIPDNNTNTLTSLDCKEYVKYLGVLIDNHLIWKLHNDYIVGKIGKTVGVIANIRRFVPVEILLKNYCSLIFQYIRYGIAAWGQAAETHTNKILRLQRRVLRAFREGIQSSYCTAFYFFTLCHGLLGYL